MVNTADKQAAKRRQQPSDLYDVEQELAKPRLFFLLLLTNWNLYTFLHSLGEGVALSKGLWQALKVGQC